MIILTEQLKVPRVAGQSAAPTVLHMNKESREEGKRYYTCHKDRAHPKEVTAETLGSTQAAKEIEPPRNIVWINFHVGHLVMGRVDTPVVFSRVYNYGNEVTNNIKHLVFVTGNTLDVGAKLEQIDYATDLKMSRGRNENLKSFSINCHSFWSSMQELKKCNNKQYAEDQKLRTICTRFTKDVKHELPLQHRWEVMNIETIRHLWNRGSFNYTGLEGIV